MASILRSVTLKTVPALEIVAIRVGITALGTALETETETAVIRATLVIALALVKTLIALVIVKTLTDLEKTLVTILGIEAATQTQIWFLSRKTFIMSTLTWQTGAKGRQKSFVISIRFRPKEKAFLKLCSHSKKLPFPNTFCKSFQTQDFQPQHPFKAFHGQLL